MPPVFAMVAMVSMMSILSTVSTLSILSMVSTTDKGHGRRGPTAFEFMVLRNSVLCFCLGETV